MEPLYNMTKGFALGNTILDNIESNRVEVNTQLLDSVREQLSSQLGHRYKLSNSALITFALLTLLEPEDRMDAINVLSASKRYNYFNELQHVILKTTPSSPQKMANLSRRELDQLSKKLDEIKNFEYANLTMNAWLLQNRVGLFTDDLPNDTRDVFMLLRSDNTVGIVDEALKAGKSEENRQAQKNAIYQ